MPRKIEKKEREYLRRSPALTSGTSTVESAVRKLAVGAMP
jgi:hypothetical protein